MVNPVLALDYDVLNVAFFSSKRKLIGLITPEKVVYFKSILNGISDGISMEDKARWRIFNCLIATCDIK